MYDRLLEASARVALEDSPILLLNGARQTGKTTLARRLIAAAPAGLGTYVTLDDASALSLARADAAGFLAGVMGASGSVLEGTLVIDEVQLAPELFPALKLLVDRERSQGHMVRGRFLLTGSANVLLLPRLSESLAGRMEILTLWPLSQAEIIGGVGDLVDTLFDDARFAARFPALSSLPCGRSDVIERLMRGGYPEPLARRDATRRRAWFSSYLTTILQRDVRDLANIEGLTALPRLLSILAARAGGLLNLADVSRAVGLPYATLYRYMSLLETTFLLSLLPPWSAQISKRLVKTPKLFLNDTGLLASLLGLDATGLGAQDKLLGALVENFVVMELRKLAGWSQVQPQLFHFRTQTGAEVDVVLESAQGRLVGIETKASATVGPDDFKGLKHLAEIAGDNWERGLVFYSGETVVPFGERLFAVPLSALWA